MSTTKLTHGQSHKYTVQGKRGKDALSKDEQDLYELCSLSGVDISPAVFRIVFDLIKMNVSPVAIVQMLKSMVHRSAKSPTTTTSDSFATYRSNITEASRSSSRSGMSTSASTTMDTGRPQSGRIGVKTSRSRPVSRPHKGHE